MSSDFKDLKQEKQKEFIFRYYPIILRRQQEESELSKLEFLNRFFMVKDKNSEYYGKLLISKSAYKRYLNLVRDIYKVYYRVAETGYEHRTPIEPTYSRLKIPKLHKKKLGFDLADRILNNFDERIFQEIWKQVQSDTWFEHLIEESKENDERLKEKTIILLNKSNLLSVVYNTLSFLSENSYHRLESATDSDDLFVPTFYLNGNLNSEDFLKNATAFLNRFKLELEEQHRKILKSEIEFYEGLERLYTEPIQRLDYFDN